VYQCPPQEESPCECYAINEPGPPYFQVACEGPEITSETLINLFARIREVSNLGTTGWMNIYHLDITNTNLKQLNMTAFYHLIVVYFNVLDNFELATLEGSVDGTYAKSIRAQHVWFQSSNLTTAGIGQALSFFVPGVVNTFSVSGNKVVDTPFGQEIIPGLSEFTQLDSISFARNAITKVGGGQFRTHGGLSRISLTGKCIMKHNVVNQYSDILWTVVFSMSDIDLPWFLFTLI